MCLVLRRLANVGRGFLSWWRVGRWVLARAAEPTVLQVRLRVWWWVAASGTNPASTFGPGIRHHLTRPASCFVVLHRWSGASKRKKRGWGRGKWQDVDVARWTRVSFFLICCFFLSFLLGTDRWIRISLSTNIRRKKDEEEDQKEEGGGRDVSASSPPTQQNWMCDVGG